MDELSRDVDFLFENTSHCTNSTFGPLYVDLPPHLDLTAPSITPKRRRVAEASNRGKVLICFFPNTHATSALMESMGYVPNYEMIVPVSN
jgi:hypothetical protein